ncbi:HTTM domain-containing protein [Negadavirga shengliensis]|uniref:HTTM domain-containing protein n=1 Tax=Negadavirga shengliensis TaxID=1389218 RepID=A0ABV9T8H8_9BACT
MESVRHVWNSLVFTLFKAVDIAPLAIFRVVFGLLLFLEGVGAVFTGWVRQVFIEPEFTFSFIPFFPWLQPLPGEGMIYYYLLMGGVGILVMLGWYYRPAIVLYFCMWTFVYWMQKSSYNNHYYLLVILTGLFVVLPANGYFSIDVWRGAVKRQYFVPNWTRLTFMLLLLIVYTYAAIAKMQADWLAAKPVKLWFEAKADIFLVGPMLTKEWVQYTVAYGGVAFDLFFVPAVWWRRTRWWALAAALFFHLFNSLVFQIGIFPYLMLATSVFFFSPASVRSFFFKNDKPVQSLKVWQHTDKHEKQLTCMLFLVCIALMLLLPLRHYSYPGNVNWTEEGHRMAWRMMLRHKYGKASFRVVFPDGEERILQPQEHLTHKQIAGISTRPDMTWQYAQYLKEKFRQEGKGEVAVYADVRASLNGRPLQPLIDPQVNLAGEPWHWFKSHDWIMPLREKKVR